MKSISRLFLLFGLLAFFMAGSANSRELFDGVGLADWKHVGFGSFVVEGGTLRPKGGVGLLWYEGEPFENVVLRVVYKVESETDNSGVFVRIPRPPENTDMSVNEGLEIQINGAGETADRRTGAVYTFTGVLAAPTVAGEWNTMDITLDGLRTAVHINGVLVTEYSEGDAVAPKQKEWDPNRGPRPEGGYIGVQNHPQGEAVRFREISIHPLGR